MKEKLYKNLTLEDKIAILHYERGASELVKITHYEDLSANPNTIPRTTDLYISSVLGFDFEEFKNNKEYINKGRKAFNAVKEVAISIHPEKDIKSGHIVDALNDVIYAYSHNDFNYDIDAKLINRIDKTLKKIYDTYNSFGVKYELIPDMLVEGEPVYRRIEE